MYEPLIWLLVQHWFLIFDDGWPSFWRITHESYASACNEVGGGVLQLSSRVKEGESICEITVLCAFMCLSSRVAWSDFNAGGEMGEGSVIHLVMRQDTVVDTCDHTRLMDLAITSSELHWLQHAEGGAPSVIHSLLLCVTYNITDTSDWIAAKGDMMTSVLETVKIRLIRFISVWIHADKI